MNILLSERVQRIKPSPTLTIAAKARTLQASGKDIISLSIGEPDFDTPQHAKTKAIEAIQNGFTKYTAVEGTLSLRKAIIQKFIKDNQLHYEPDQILVSCGAKQSFFNLMQALLSSGDEVIIPAPYWVSYPDMVLLADGKPIIINAGIEQHFKITPHQLEQAITPKTKLFIINSPSNPTGIAYTADELKALAAVLLRHPQILIATDDIYEHILWSQEPFHNILMVCPELYSRSLVINGASKTYAMTGWRIGYAAGPKDLIQAMFNIQGQSTSGACSIAQVAAQAALEDDQHCVTTMVTAFKERHDFVVDALRHIPGIECLDSDGTFYAFPKVQTIIDRMKDIENDTALAACLLDEVGVAVVPGEAFGAPGYLRLSFATSMDKLREALKRLTSCLTK